MRTKILKAFYFLGFITFCSSVSGQKSESFVPERVWTYDPLEPNAECLPASGCPAWRNFRRAHPWPYQAIAVAENNGEMVVILSEPAPVLTRVQYQQALRALFGDQLLDLTFFRWPTGLDGYLEDIVLRVRVDTSKSVTRYVSGNDLAPATGPAEVVDRLRMLYRLEYGTSDGFWMDSADRPAQQAPIDELKVPLGDLYGWISSKAGTWRSLDKEGTPTLTSAQMAASASAGAFANDSGIVAFLAPRKAKLADLRAPFRRFAVASDLILGAIGSQNGSMLLLARMRTVPLSQLPPLRFETFAGFARNRAADIAQSYERQRIFAGKIQTGKYIDWDWAPILLSSQLDDTEFGTLLNQADQILKSWSQHGEVEYYAFPYPKPETYPFGDEAATDYFGKKFKTTSLLFNWNTDDFSQIARVGSQEVLTASRTGALRILYRPSADADDLDKAQAPADDAEKDAIQKAVDAQNYFAQRGNSILVRVVQNVLLYQAEQNFLSIADAQSAPSLGRSDRVGAVLEAQAVRWLTAATQRKPTGDKDVLLLEVLNELLKKSGLTPQQFAKLIASPQKIMIELERSRQKALQAEREALALAQQSDDNAAAASSMFRNACGSVAGTLSNDPLKGLVCDWKKTEGAVAPAAFGEAHALEGRANQEDAAAEAAIARRNKLATDAETLEDRYVRAAALGRVVTELSGAADLDAVLAEAVKAGAANASTGFIRTPSVVLSKNVLSADAVGGHNIDLVPTRVATEFKPSSGIKVAAVPMGQAKGPAIRIETVTEPPKAIDQVIGKPRSGTLLADMRSRTNADPSIFSDVSARAKACNCDAVISQSTDGTILFVRNTPPAVEQVIYGKSGVIDAMAPPPVLKEVHFENFDSASVENLARTQQLLNSNLDANGFDRAVADLKAAFSGDRRGNQAEILIARENGEPEFFRLIGDYDERVSLKEKVSWRTAEVREPSGGDWESTFGDAASSENSTRFIVRFGVGGKDALGISASGAANPGFASRLKILMNQWLGRQAALPAPTPISGALVDLRASIMTKLKPNQLLFYIKRNGGLIRGARLDFPAEPGAIGAGE